MSKLWLSLKSGVKKVPGLLTSFVSSGGSWWLLVVGASLVGGAVLWHQKSANQALHDARADGESTVRLTYVAAENRSILNQREQIIDLSVALAKSQKEFNESKTNSKLGKSRADASGKRVRDASTPAGGELDQRVGAASCDVARSFGADSFRTAVSCRDSLAEIGLGSDGLVESTARAERAEADVKSLTNFAMPRSPFTQEPTK